MVSANTQRRINEKLRTAPELAVLRRHCRRGWSMAPAAISNTLLRMLAKAGLIRIRVTKVYGGAGSKNILEVKVM